MQKTYSHILKIHLYFKDLCNPQSHPRSMLFIMCNRLIELKGQNKYLK